ncbi:MAG TPA: acetamidase/formamidase family protein [Bryobacteraceae bacterium]|nr:acetamidase/formamidase family protein [Bryobacteraceae bacterium]
MRLTLTVFLLVCVKAWTQTPADDLTGNWIFEIEHHGDRMMATRAQMKVADGKIAGRAGDSEIRGTITGSTLNFKWLARNGNEEAGFTGKYENGSLSGAATSPDGLTYTWIAYREVTGPAEPRTHDFTPTEFERYFSAATKPVLRIRPGDTVRTWSLDAGGRDREGTRRSLGGNPLSGPFFIEGALPGDTLVVRLNRVRLNRDWAQSGAGIVSNAVTPDYSANLKRAENFSSRWRLDAHAGTAALEKPTEALRNFRIPLDPMVGCVAVAPPRKEVISTRDSGAFGGNMDYNRIREGTTVYLPVNHPGALLLVGDGHAAQGDGELTGDALETSMEIEFTVNIIRGRSAGSPYAEDDEYWMMIGIAGSLDEALRRATTRAARYLEIEHGLNSTEAAVVLGFALKYDVADLVGTQVSVVAKLPKKTLAQLPPRKTP